MERLLHNLWKKRLPSEIVNYVQEMLKNRRTRLRFDDHTSEWFDITNGISQGDPFSMLLYIVYDSDLVTVAKNKDELTLTFVDDTVLLAIAKSFQDTHRILGDMLEREGGAYEWSADHNSRFETSKFGLVDFTLSKSKPRPPMTIRGNVIMPAPSHKFLGVVVDQELRWKEHIAYALAKGAGYAALLRCLSRPAHGIPTRLIRQLYRAIAVPKMLYAASVWIKLLFSGDSNTTLRGSQGVTRKMTQAQRTAALVITGAMKTSPTDSLEIHANLLPMPLLLQHLLHNAALRLASRPQSHPLHAIVKRAAKHNVKCHKTALHHLFHGLRINPEKIETISPHPIHPTSLTLFITDIASSKEEAIVNFQNCTSRTMIFTDGSSHNGLVGAAAVLFIDHNHIATLRHHLGKATEHTVFEAEAVGLLLAAHLLTQRREVTFPAMIFADNQAAIQSSSHPTAKPGHYLLIHFRKLMKRLQNKKNVDREALSLNWIAGHADILGNKLADREAKLAASSPTNATLRHLLPKILRKPLPASISAAKQDHNAKLQNRWLSIWKQSPRYDHMATIDPSSPSKAFTKLTKYLGKKQSSIYVQLRTGHVPLNKHLYRFKCSDTPLCLQCNDERPESVHHFLFECPRYNRERHTLRTKIGQKALSLQCLLADSRAQRALFIYINETKRLKATFGEIPLPPEKPG